MTSKAAYKHVDYTTHRGVRIDHYRAVEEHVTAQVRPSVLRRVGGFFKKLGRSVVGGIKTVVGAVVATVSVPFVSIRMRQWMLPGWMWSVVSFVRNNWGWLLAGSLWMVALIIAPVPTLLGSVFIAAGFTIMMYGGSFALLFVGRVIFEVGMQILIEGLFNNRRRSY